MAAASRARPRCPTRAGAGLPLDVHARDERSRDRDEAIEQSSLSRTARSKFEGRLFVFQVAANIIVLGILLVLMLSATIRIADINQRQLDAVKNQNIAQICTQHDIIIAVRSIAEQLGLPTDQIIVPDVSDLDCP